MFVLYNKNLVLFFYHLFFICVQILLNICFKESLELIFFEVYYLSGKKQIFARPIQVQARLINNTCGGRHRHLNGAKYFLAVASSHRLGVSRGSCHYVKRHALHVWVQCVPTPNKFLLNPLMFLVQVNKLLYCIDVGNNLKKTFRIKC